MSDYEFIMAQCRKFHFTGWDESVLRECQSVLPNLARQELVSVYRSRRLDAKHPLKQTAFKVLFADKVGKREERLRTMPVEELIAEFRDKKSGNVALARKELRDRYKNNKGDERQKVAQAFNQSTKADRLWVKSQVRREEFERKYGKPLPPFKPSYRD